MAAEKNLLKIMLSILSSGAGISGACRRNPLVASAIINFIKEKPHVLERFSAALRNDYEFLTIALEGVDKKEREKFIHNIVGEEIRPRILAEKQRGDDVVEAARKVDIKSIQALLENGAISEEDRGIAVSNAVFIDHLNAVQILLANGAQISKEDRGEFVEYAASEGNLEMVRILLANEASIYEGHRGLAVIAAAIEDRFDLVQVLLKNGALISYNDRYEAVQIAEERGHQAIAEFLRPGLQN